MYFMNEYEINEALQQNASTPVLDRATRFLAAFRDEVNANSDGWCYWKPPVKAAKKLMKLVNGYSEPSEYQLMLALVPIKSFYTRRGYATGMKFPEVN